MKRGHFVTRALAVVAIAAIEARAFELVREYKGATFFDRWDFYGNWDNLTLGNVSYLDRESAASQRLAYINDAGNAIMKVDNTSFVPWGGIRNAIRITSQDSYDYGSLWIVDLLHVPYGCSVWPAFWAKGPTWPDDGEIDIVEAINLMDHNQYALHTTRSCLHDTNITQLGHDTNTDCGTGSGCVVAEKPASYGAGFAAQGGGVFATQFDVSGIFMWYWARADIPPSISQAGSSSSIDISTWGTPSAAFPVTQSCDLTSKFTTQQLIFNIALCGVWAGVPGIYSRDCANSNPNGTCYGNVVGPGSPTYDNAYFEVSYLRAYTINPQPTSPAVSSGNPAPTDPPATPTQLGVAPTTVSGNTTPPTSAGTLPTKQTGSPAPSTSATSGADFAQIQRLSMSAVVAVIGALVWLMS